MFERLGSWTYRFRFLIAIAWIVGAVLCVRFAPSLAGQGSTDQASFLPPTSTSVLARDALEQAFPGSTANSSTSITFERAGGITDTDRAYRDAFAAWTTSAEAPAELRQAVTGTETADSRPELEAMLRSPDGQLEMLVVNLNVANAGDEAALVVKQLREHLVATTPPGLETHVTGAAAISSDYLDAIKAGTDSTTMVTVLLVVIILLLIYRAPLAALVPLVTIGAAFVVSRGVLGILAAAGWQVSSLLDTFIVVLVFGVGTDYAIFLISRYREEVSGGGDWHDAARSTVRRIGAVITASAATVIVGMCSMAFGEFKMISSTGPAIGVAIFVTLIAGLTLAPALLSIFGHYLFWPLHTRAKPEGEPGGFFAKLAAAVSRRPGLVTVVLLIALLIPAAYLPQVKTNFDVLAELPATSDSRLGYDAVALHLGEDKLVQSTGVVNAGGGGDMLAPASLAKLRDLMVELQGTPGVATVTSLVTPEGDGVVPDGFRPSKQLATIGDQMSGDTGGGKAGDSASLLGTKVSDGLDTALAYVNGLALAYPDVAAGPELRAVTGGLQDAQDIIDRVRKQSVLSTQLRNLATAITSPTSAAGGTSGEGSSASLMSDYLKELATAYPEVRALPAYKDATKAATSLENKASIQAALDLSAAFEKLAQHFDGRPDATLSPTSLSGTSSAKQLKKEAEDVFNALPDQFQALGAVFATRPDDIYVPTTLTGEDAKKVQDAVDAFVSKDRAATRFYLTSSNDPYSGGAFKILRTTQDEAATAAPGFGPAASAYIGGPTAQFADVQDTLAQDFQRVGVITVIGILVVLILLLRALVAPLYLVGTVLISYASAVGLSAWIFQEVLHQPGISFYLPLMVFVLLVALGSDYNIFLMSRVREESETRPIKDGIRIASGHTGSVITSAGLILAGTFGSMATAPLAVLFQVGVAVAIGVLIDTFIVRSILVPAITTLVGDHAWWPSGSSLARSLGWGVPAGAGAGAAAGAAAGAGAGAAAGIATARPGGAAGFAGTRLSRRALAGALALVVLVPVTAAALLTWSLGAQASNLSSVGAAIVNLDEGGSLTAPDGTIETLHLGSDLVTSLVSPGADTGFAWQEVSPADAASGLDSGRYSAILTVPADFSRTVAALRSDPTGSAPKASLGLLTDDRSSYTTGAVARAVMAAIGDSAAKGITASYVDDVLLSVSHAQAGFSSASGTATGVADNARSLADDASGVGSVASELVSGLQKLADGASQSQAGTNQLVSGTAALASGARKLATGTDALAAGITKAADGAGKLADGAKLVSDGMAALTTQTASLPTQTDQLATGVKGVVDGVAAVDSQAAVPLADGLGKMAKETKGLGDLATGIDGGVTGIASSATDLGTLAGQANSLAGDMSKAAAGLDDGLAAYTTGVAGLAGNCAAMGGTDPLCAELAKLAASNETLTTTSAQLKAGTAGVAAMTGPLETGVTGLASGATKLQKEATGPFAASAPLLETGIHDSAAGATALHGGLAKIVTDSQPLVAGMRQLADGTPALTGGIAQLADGAAGVSAGNTSLASGLDDLASGADQLATGAKATAAGATKLATGTAQAAGGTGKLVDAVQSAADAAALVEAEAGTVADDGTTLQDSAKQLAKDLATAAGSMHSYAADTRQRMGELAASPVTVDAVRRNGAGGTDGGFAPFFLALAIWLGTLGAFLVLPGIWWAGGRSWSRAALAGFAAGAILVGAGAALAVGGLHVVGIEAANLPALLAFAALTALAFVAIVQAFVAGLGARGWLLALIFLLVQVAAVGFLYPAASTPGLVSVLHALVPMTYAVDALRGAIVGGGASPQLDAIVLGAWLVVALLITLAIAASAERRGGAADEPAPGPGNTEGAVA